MVQILVITLGEVAESLVEAAGRIVGKSVRVHCFCLDWESDIDDEKDRLGRRIRELNRGGGVLLLTDMYGGSSTNIALAHHRPGEIEVITGVNIPMVIRASTLTGEITVSEAAQKLIQQSKDAIRIARESL